MSKINDIRNEVLAKSVTRNIQTGGSAERVNFTQKTQLITELVWIFRQNGFDVHSFNGSRLHQPRAVLNRKLIGDGEDKMPDIHAYDRKNGRIVRGLVKIAKGDIDTEHSLTQYRLFSACELESKLYIISEVGWKEYLISVVARSVPRYSLGNIVFLESRRF